MNHHRHIPRILLGLAAAILTGCIGAAGAGEISLAWDDDQPGMVYRIEMAEPVEAPAQPVWTTVKDNIPQILVAPFQQQTTITGLAPGRRLFRAFARHAATQLESEPSSVLDTGVNPSPPSMLRKKVALQESSDLKTWRDVFVEESETTEQKTFYRVALAFLPTP